MNKRKILIASTNKNKLSQIKEKLFPLGLDIVSMSDLRIAEPEENGKSYSENAIIKAENAFLQTKIPSIADDSGFELDYLNGFPGVVSARFAKACGGYEKTFEILNKCLASNKNARFRTFVAFVYEKDGKIIKEVFEGNLAGNFVFPPRGSNGFGYCPCFQPDGYNQTMSEISDDLREKINHRAIALDKLYEFLKNNMENFTLNCN